MSVQILTASGTLTQVEIDRLKLHEFRCPPVSEFVTGASWIIDNGFLSDEIIKDYADLESMRYYQIDDYVYCFMKLSNLDHFQSTVNRFNKIENSLGQSTGLIESDLATLTIVTVYPAEIAEQIVQVNLDLYVESIKRVVYL